jgi:uncharacterized membrane protein
MRVRAVVLILLLSILIGLAVYAMIYFFVPSDSPGRGYGGATLHYAWAPIVAVPVSFSMGLLTYLALFPEIKQVQNVRTALQTDQQAFEAVRKVLKDDERKVVELLMSSGGSMLQREIARQSGFSRVKTHRILYRLSTRGIVVAEKYFNTYKITLADWLYPTRK